MTTHLDGMDENALAAWTGAPRVALFDEVASTMDEAHRLGGEGAPAGTVVVAGSQTAGRGRFGRRWVSDAAQGLWMTVLERDVDGAAFAVLSLRIGIALAPVLDAFAGAPVSIKWPNDLIVLRRKLAGILVEARWRGTTPEWVAVGIGVNIVAPGGQPVSAGLVPGTRRSEVLRALVAPLRAACRGRGELTPDEMVAFSARDAARGERLIEPAAGRARGITANGALMVETDAGTELFTRGSLTFAAEAG